MDVDTTVMLLLSIWRPGALCVPVFTRSILTPPIL